MRAPDAHFWRDLQAGLRFVRGTPLLVTLAVHRRRLADVPPRRDRGADPVRHAHAGPDRVADRPVASSAWAWAPSLASVLGHRISARIGPGPCLLLGLAHLRRRLAAAGGWRRPMPGAWLTFALMLLLFGVGAVLIFINFLALRQAVTPTPLLGRMTSTMRWLILLPAGPGALIGGWLGEHVGLRASLAFAGVAALVLALLAWRCRCCAACATLPAPEATDDARSAPKPTVSLQRRPSRRALQRGVRREAVDGVGDQTVEPQRRAASARRRRVVDRVAQRAQAGAVQALDQLAAVQRCSWRRRRRSRATARTLEPAVATGCRAAARAAAAGAVVARAVQRLGLERTQQRRRALRPAHRRCAASRDDLAGGAFVPRRGLDLDVQRMAVARQKAATHRAGQRLAGIGAAVPAPASSRDSRPTAARRRCRAPLRGAVERGVVQQEGHAVGAAA